MKEFSQSLYSRLCDEIKEHREKNIPTAEKMEGCFFIAQNYWHILRREVERFEFQTIEEEIEFFKVIKPKFTSEIEYYTLLYSALAFIPQEVSTDDLMVYWQEELNKMDKWVSANFNFYTYYKSGDTNCDREYFTRNGCTKQHAKKEYKLYQDDCSSASSCDHFVASLIALEKFQCYCLGELTRLRT